jgi:hypothetical protein
MECGEFSIALLHARIREESDFNLAVVLVGNFLQFYESIKVGRRSRKKPYFIYMVLGKLPVRCYGIKKISRHTN